jgi:hypothetical protein
LYAEALTMINPGRWTLILLLLAAAGCDTRSLIAREPPPDSGAPETQAPAGKPDETDAAAPVEDASPSSPPDSGPADLGLPVIVDPPFTIPDTLVGTWKGYLQAAVFRSGSDTVVVNLIRAQGEPDRITVTLGDTAPTSTPPYPDNDYVRVGGPSFYLEGLPYPAHHVRWRGSRLTFEIANGDLYRTWCEMQVPRLEENGVPRYTCSPIEPVRGKEECDSGSLPLSQACKAHLICGSSKDTGLCACNASVCAADTALTAAFDITFDVPVVGATTAGGNNVTLRLARAPQAAAQ